MALVGGDVQMERLPDPMVSAVIAITTARQQGPMVLVGIATVMVQPLAPMGSVVGGIATEPNVAQMDLVAFVATKSPNNSFARDAPQGARPSS
jgi:hypothetical protein